MSKGTEVTVWTTAKPSAAAIKAAAEHIQLVIDTCEGDYSPWDELHVGDQEFYLSLAESALDAADRALTQDWLNVHRG